MSEYLESHPNLLRQSTVGDVIYVHLTNRHRHAPQPVLPAAPEPEPEAVSLLSVEPLTVEEPAVEAAEVLAEVAPETVAPAPEPVAEAAPAPKRRPSVELGWSYRVAPQGYAIEFGTGRLVPIVYAGGRH